MITENIDETILVEAIGRADPEDSIITLAFVIFSEEYCFKS